MSKYVCDYDVVSQVGNQLIQSCSDLESATTTYAGRFESDLSSWTGSSKAVLTKQFSGQVEIMKKRIQYVNEFGEFIVKTAQSIQELDQQLGAMNI